MRLTSETALIVALDVALILQLFGLWLAVMLDEYIQDRRRNENRKQTRFRYHYNDQDT